MKTRKHGIIAILLLICAVCIGTIGVLVADKIHHQNEMSELEDIAYASNSISEISDEAMKEQTANELASELTTEESDAATSSSTEITEDSKDNELFVDIVALQDVNPDIFAWIRIPGTKVDYPVTQHPVDDEYYLKHGADGMSSNYGCPFIEICDSTNLDQFNTVIYGHNMNDGSMFAGLHDFEDKDFYDNHRWVYICTAEHVFSYEIFAAVMYSDTYIPYYYDDKVAEQNVAFLNSLRTDIVPERSIISEDISVNEDCKILTLSTCDKKLRDNRFIVVSVLRQIDGQDV